MADRLASETDVNFGSNFALNQLFNVAVGTDSDVEPTLVQQIRTGVAVMIGITT